MQQNVLLVVSILEGRNFPVRTGDVIIVEAVFGGECLATDQVNATAKLQFDAELAWELDRHGLHLHRLQRSPIKLQCFLCDQQGRKKSSLGYLILDIRNTKDKRAEHVWWRLLNSKSDKKKPELLIGLYLEEESKRTDWDPAATSNSTTPLINEQPPSLSAPKVKGSFTSEHLKPKLNAGDGYYQIGPAEQCTEFYSLSVTLVFAENLSQLAVDGDDEETTKKSYTFHYSLLGNDVISEAFHDLTKAEFPAERSAARIRSSLSALQSYIKKQPTLDIYLLCDKVPIAQTSIPLESVLVSMQVNGVFPLKSLTNRSWDEGVLKPGVGVLVALQKEDPHVSEDTNLNQDSVVKEEQVRRKSSEESVSKKKNDEISTRVGDSPDAVPSFLNGDDSSKRSTSKKSSEDVKSDSVEMRSSKIVEMADDKETLRHFHFVLDLKTLRTDPSVEPFNCFLRYSYPFFGTSTPILTYPCVRVTPNTDVLLPHGYCSFDFVTNIENLQKTFRNIPLIVEMLEEIPGYPDGCLLGMVKICLHPVLDSPPSRALTPNGKVSERKNVSCHVPVVSPDGKTVGTMKVVTGLVDLGPADLSRLVTNKESTSDPTEYPRQATNNNNNNEKLDDWRNQRDVMPLMMELEMWKEKQEILFRNQLRAKEAEHLKTLTHEWKQRDVDRELVVQKKLQECKQQEDRLKRALADVELREKQLREREAAANAKRAENALQMQKMEDEAKDSIRRVRLECDYKVELERKRNQSVVEDNRRLQSQVSEKERKIKEKDAEIESLLERLKGTSEVRLRSELEIANLERAELNRKLEVVTSAKNRYKEQWAKALKRVSTLQQQHHLAENGRLDTMRLDEEQTTLENEKRALARIKEEVDSLKRRLDQTKDTSSDRQTIIIEDDDYVNQLTRERDMLLSTGVYSPSDRIVVELEKHIADASARASSSK